MSRDVKVWTNKGRGVPLSASSVVSSFCFFNDLLMVHWKREVVDGGALEEPMAKLLSVVRWPSIGGGELYLRRRMTVLREQLRCGGRSRQWSGSSEAQDGVVGVVLVQRMSASVSWSQLWLGFSY